MKIRTKHGDTELYKLPNHSWHPEKWCPIGSKYDTPETVVRRTDYGVLVRNCSWEQAKNPHYNWSKEFCGEHRPNDTWKTFDLYATGTSIIGILTQRAREGNAEAAMELARIAGEATESLNKICNGKPELVRPLSRLRRAWPVIKKANEELSCAEKDLFAGIQLGIDSFIELDPQTAKWKWDDAGKIAYGLLYYVWCSRGNPPHPHDNGAIGECVRSNLPPNFDDESASYWWKIAKEILLFSYPEPQAVPELVQLVPATIRNKQGQEIPNPKRTRPGDLKQEILRILKARFLAFAPNKSFERGND